MMPVDKSLDTNKNENPGSQGKNAVYNTGNGNCRKHGANSDQNQIDTEENESNLVREIDFHIRNPVITVYIQYSLAAID